MTPRDKLLNDFLYAPSRYLDRYGNIVHANPVTNFLLSPQAKVGGLTTLVTTFLASTTAAPETLPFALVAGATGTVLAYSNRNKFFHTRDNFFGAPPEYYFDTNPHRKVPLKNTGIILDLIQEHQRMIGRLRRTTAIAAVMLPVGGVIFHLSGLDPMSAALVSASVVLTQSGTNAMNHLSKAWRAGQALKGNWNVLTAKPEKQKVESRIESFNAVPQASPG